MHHDFMHVDEMLLEILLVCKPFLTLHTREILLSLVYSLPMILELAGDPEPFGAEVAGQAGTLSDQIPVGTLPVLAEVCWPVEGHGAELTAVGLGVRVGVHVGDQVAALGERLEADGALVVLHLAVQLRVSVQRASRTEHFAAIAAHKLFAALVGRSVFGEEVRSLRDVITGVT